MNRVKKRNGFMMAEVVVVSAIVLVVLGALFVSFNKLLLKFDSRVAYYDTTTLFQLAYYRDVLIENGALEEAMTEANTNGVYMIYDSEHINSGLINLTEAEINDSIEERVQDAVYLVYNHAANISSDTFSTANVDIKLTFNEYLDYLSKGVDLTKTNYVMLMERCNIKVDGGENDCKYAYLEIFDGYETN